MYVLIILSGLVFVNICVAITYLWVVSSNGIVQPGLQLLPSTSPTPCLFQLTRTRGTMSIASRCSRRHGPRYYCTCSEVSCSQWTSCSWWSIQDKNRNHEARMAKVQANKPTVFINSAFHKIPWCCFSMAIRVL